jgi:hypothetical protein
MIDIRKPLLAALLCALLSGFLATPAIPQTPGSQIKPLGYCQLSVTTAVQTSTCSGFSTLATYAAVCNEGSAARWRDDGTAPTTTIGQPWGSGTATAPVCGSMATTFSTLQWVAESGTATLDFTFYK